MKSLLIIIPLILVYQSCKKNVTIPLETTAIEQTVSWSGHYFFKGINKDGLTTSFDITISNLSNITIIYIGDSEKPETYKNLKAEVINDHKININFNAQYGEMGVIVLEENENNFLISGLPIYSINPGSDALIIDKIN